MTSFTDEQLFAFARRRLEDDSPDEGVDFSQAMPGFDTFHQRDLPGQEDPPDVQALRPDSLPEGPDPGAYIDAMFGRQVAGRRPPRRRSLARFMPEIKLTTPYDDFEQGPEFRMSEPLLSEGVDPAGLLEHLGNAFLTGTVFEPDESEHESNAMEHADDDERPLYRYFACWIEQPELEWYDAVLLELARRAEDFRQWHGSGSQGLSDKMSVNLLQLDEDFGIDALHDSGFQEPGSFEQEMTRLGLTEDFIGNAFAIRRVFEHIESVETIQDAFDRAFPDVA